MECAVDRHIELLRIGPGSDDTVQWPHGPQRSVEPTPDAVALALSPNTGSTNANAAVLLLDARFPLPTEALLDRLLGGPADVWHGGVALGLDGQPTMWDHVDPLSMFSARLDPTVEATSWRVSLRALLVRSAVLEQLGGPDAGFDTLSGSGMDAGLRWIRAGALVRHVPDLVPSGAERCEPPTAADGLRLVGRHRGRVWAGWALQRAVWSHELKAGEILRLSRSVRHVSAEALPHYRPAVLPGGTGRTDRTVSVVVPTIDRYPYLEPLLHQLAAQTVAPHEVLVVDQTPIGHRRHDLTSIEPDLPVTVIEIPKPGQCTARNAALQAATGEIVLFLDDDLEIPSTLLADHLELLVDCIDGVAGAVDDATSGPPPDGFRHRRASDVLPGGNTMVRRTALESSGLFDPAYDHGSRADHDLGMRLHLGGALLVYDPAVEVFHHHAPAGGLRTHGARKVTRASARRSLTERHLPTATQLYLAHRYYSPHQRREGRRISLLAVLMGEGSASRRLARAAVQLALLPSSIRRLLEADRAAVAMVASRQPIPMLRGSCVTADPS
jgi:GT2 family glycosyltransferase